MTRLTSLVALTVVAAGVLCAGALCGARTSAPARPPERVFAFLSHAGGRELVRLREVGRRISVLAPNWYTLHVDTGALQAPSQPQPVLAAARATGVPVWPVVNARTGGSPAILDARVRERAAQALARVAADPAYAGLTLDMEELLPAQRDAFSALVARIAQLVHAQRRRLAVYVPRPSGVGSALAYDLRALGGAADLVLVSTYNEHVPGSDPGPLDSAEGFAHVLESAADVSRRRVAPILGAIGYTWPQAGGRGRMLSTVEASRGRVACHERASVSDGSATYVCDGRVVYYAPVAGLRARARAVGGAGFRWLALFSLGREPRSFWDGMPNVRAQPRRRS